MWQCIVSSQAYILLTYAAHTAQAPAKQALAQDSTVYTRLGYVAFSTGNPA